jgi:sec-independent protein translocase protein TatB
MFGIGTPELVVILIVALLVLGPAKLPELMRSLGKGIAEFKKMSQDVTSTLDMEIRKAEEDKRKTEAKQELSPDGAPPVAEPMASTVAPASESATVAAAAPAAEAHAAKAPEPAHAAATPHEPGKTDKA